MAILGVNFPLWKNQHREKILLQRFSMSQPARYGKSATSGVWTNWPQKVQDFDL